MGNSVGELFFRGGWVMWPLLIFSVITWAVVLERAYILILARNRFSRLVDGLKDLLDRGDLTGARERCESAHPSLQRLFLEAMETGKGRDSAMRMTERNAARMVSYLKKNLWVLGTIASASPFIGLLGTVVGIVRAFHDMAEKGAGGFSVVAGGISEALVATAAGLIVAIVALLTYNIFMTYSNQLLATVRLSLDEVLDRSFDRTVKTG